MSSQLTEGKRLITNLIPNPLFILPSSSISTWEATVQHFAPDGITITPNSDASNPYAHIQLCEPVSGDFHLNFWISPVPQDAQWYENGIVYVYDIDFHHYGLLMPRDNTAGNEFLGFDFHMNNLQNIQLKCPSNRPLTFSAINLMTQADWQAYKKFVPGMGTLYGDLAPQ